MDTVRERRHQEELLKVAEQAAEWLVVLDEGAPRDRAAFAAWIEESPLHVEMFLRASAVNQIGELVAPADRAKLLESVLSRAHDSNVVALDSTPPPVPAARVAGFRRHWQWVAGIVAVVSVAVWVFVAGPYSWQRYATAVGEQRALALSDGSLVYVNTNTRVDVRYSKHAREIQLRSGEALFKVEHDPSRPFRVHVGDTVVQAVGTQFNIYRRATDTTVAVIEGVVQVSKDGDLSASGEAQGSADVAASVATMSNAKSPHHTERLAAGQAMNLAADGVMATPSAVNVAQVTAWRQRRLVFEWATLDAITQEFNRYNRTPHIRVEGDSVRARRYTAVFDADNPQTLLKFLAKDGELRFAAEGDDFVIRGR